MIITGFMAASVVWCLFYNYISNGALLLLCVCAAGLFLWSGHGHGKENRVEIDQLAGRSRLSQVPPLLKILLAISLMASSICAGKPVIGIQIAVVLALAAIFAGGVKISTYLQLIAVPLSFLMLSGLALLWEYSPSDKGDLSIFIGIGYLCVTKAAQARAMLVMARALGAVSALYLLSLSTPLPEIIGVLRRLRCPDVVTELMYLIYRYIFLLFHMHDAMKNSAMSRLGYLDYPTGIRTTGRIYSNLLAYSYRQASRNFDAMESRCFDGSIRFLETRREWKPIYIAGTLFLAVLELALCVMAR